ncbi:MAG: tyrosine-type recombinase/integrase [Egibacteraceae bacterium]
MGGPAASQITVAAWWTIWRATKADLRPSALARLDSTVKTHVLPEWGRLPLQGVSNAAVRAWIARMVAAGMSASSVRKAHFALHQMLQAAVADRKLACDPDANVPLPPERHGEQRFLNADEVAALAEAMTEVERATAERTGRDARRRFERFGPRYQALILVAAYGGLRFGELAALRRRRVDLLRGRLTVAQTLVDLNGELSFGPPKTKNGRRTVPLPRRVVRELAAHTDAHVGAAPDALVFTNTKSGPLRRAGFRRNWWQPAVRKAGLDPLSFHELRHTFVSLWVAVGANAKEVSVRAGHSSAAFTLDRYGHLYQDDAIADRLDDLLRRAKTDLDAEIRPFTIEGSDTEAVSIVCPEEDDKRRAEAG